jgi:hypothetical protein
VKTLRAIEFLLTEIEKYDEIYALKENEASPSRGLSIFKSTFKISVIISEGTKIRSQFSLSPDGPSLMQIILRQKSLVFEVS